MCQASGGAELTQSLLAPHATPTRQVQGPAQMENVRPWFKQSESQDGDSTAVCQTCGLLTWGLVGRCQLHVHEAG